MSPMRRTASAWRFLSNRFPPMNVRASSRPTGMTGFLVIWTGQVISILASGVSSFALSIWLFQQTRSATAMGAMQVCCLLPCPALSPLAGGAGGSAQPQVNDDRRHPSSPLSLQAVFSLILDCLVRAAGCSLTGRPAGRSLVGAFYDRRDRSLPSLPPLGWRVAGVGHGAPGYLLWNRDRVDCSEWVRCPRCSPCRNVAARLRAAIQERGSCRSCKLTDAFCQSAAHEENGRAAGQPQADQGIAQETQ